MSVNPKKHLFLLFFSALLAAFSLGSIITFTDPSTASWLTFSFFYISLFIMCLGIFTLIGLGIRKWLGPQLYIINLGNSFRQAFLVSILIVISFILTAQNILFWWVEGSLILFFAAVEAFLNLKI
jgi:hypothetical protein